MPFTVQHLTINQQKVVTVTPDQTIQSALDLMIESDFSQLPVIDNDRRVLGLVTSDSIVRALNHLGVSVSALKVSDAVIKANEYYLNDDLFDLLDALRDNYAVLIVDNQKRLTGIVTNYDATEYFRRRAEDIMLVEDIESILKEDIQAIFSKGSGEIDEVELQTAIGEITDSKQDTRKRFEKALKQYLQLQGASIGFNQQHADQAFQTQFGKSDAPKPFEQLTLHEFIELLLHRNHWDKVAPVFNLDRESIRRLLGAVRETRNMLAHFRGEITTKQRDELRYCGEWLVRHKLGMATVSPVSAATIAEDKLLRAIEMTQPSSADEQKIIPTEEDADSDSKYAPLASWLQAQTSDVRRIPLSFNKIEEIIGDDLPATARHHRSWWANDSTGHVQSQQWLSVGWRIADIDILGEQVTFARIIEREKAYIHFFSNLLNEFHKVASFPTRSGSPDGMNWHTISGVPEPGPQIGSLAFVFTRRNQFRIELYIDTGDAKRNKQIFDALYARKETIESTFGESLNWERMDAKRASRICIYHDGAITDGKEKLNQLRDWGIKTMIRFQKVISAEASRVSRGNG